MRKAEFAVTLKKLMRDTRGTSGIEFGIIAPVLLLMLLGTIEIGRAIDNNRHFVAAVQTAGDLVAREASLGKTEAAATANIEGMMELIKQIMQPFDASTLKLAVYSVRVSADDPDQAKVEWRHSYNGMEVPAKCSEYSLPPNMIAAGGSVIVVDATYQFKSLFGSYVPGMSSTMTWTDKSHHSPRNKCVDYVEGDNCVAAC